MKILLTVPKGSNFDRYFPQELIDRLKAIGELTLNEGERQLTRDELSELLFDKDIVLTHWGSIQYDEELLKYAPRLRLLAHCAGTVAHIAGDEFYKRGIPVLSANPVMAKYVAEWVLGAMICALRDFRNYDSAMREGKWRGKDAGARSLFDTDIGLVGLGAVGRELISLLEPFGCTVKVYDPYIGEDALKAYKFARSAAFSEVMGCDIVSVHASKTPETYHMIDAGALSLMKDGAILINSARGALVDTEALISELERGRLFAVLDVYESENCPQDPRLLACLGKTLLQPHTAALPAGSRMTSAVIDDIERFAKGEELKLAVSYSQYMRMTQE